MGNKRTQDKRTPRPNASEERMLKNLSDLEDFRDFTKLVPKKLRDALLRGATSQEIYDEFGHLAAARAVLIAMTDRDSGRALAAIKELLDRSQGKATEKKEIRHNLDKLSDEELEAVYRSEIADVEEG